MERNVVEIVADRFSEILVAAPKMSVLSWLMILSPLFVIGIIWYVTHRKIKL